jgi:hypothetical protein
MDEEVEVQLPSHARYRSLSRDRSLSRLSALPQSVDAVTTNLHSRGIGTAFSPSLRGAKRRGNLGHSDIT